MTFFQVLQSRAPKWSAGALLAFLMYNVFVTTLLMRVPYDYYRFDLRPFHQLKIAMSGNMTALWELVLNFFMLFPLGLLLPVLLNTKKRFVISCKVGAATAVFIEITQLVTRLGEFQTDDIIANSLGAIAGSVTACAAATVRKNLRRENLRNVNKSA